MVEVRHRLEGSVREERTRDEERRAIMVVVVFLKVGYMRVAMEWCVFGWLKLLQQVIPFVPFQKSRPQFNQGCSEVKLSEWHSCAALRVLGERVCQVPSSFGGGGREVSKVQN